MSPFWRAEWDDMKRKLRVYLWVLAPFLIVQWILIAAHLGGAWCQR